MISIQSINPSNLIDAQNQSQKVEPKDQFSATFASLLDRPEKPALSVESAKLLMYRSMTTGVPNSELEQYGGYAAVKELFEANGGKYDILSISKDLRRQLAEKVSHSGVGNMLTAQIENLPIATSVLQVMTDAGVDSSVIEQLRSSGNELTTTFKLTSMQPQQSAITLVSVEDTPSKPALSAESAKLLMYRSMTTGVPNSELEQYGGYAAVKELFEANGGKYDILSISEDLRRQLAEKVSHSGVGNMLTAQIENLPIATSVLQVMTDAGVDSGVIEQLRSSGNVMTQDQITLSAEINQAKDKASLSAGQYVDSTLYLSSLFKT